MRLFQNYFQISIFSLAENVYIDCEPSLSSDYVDLCRAHKLYKDSMFDRNYMDHRIEILQTCTTSPESIDTSPCISRKKVSSLSTVLLGAVRTKRLNGFNTSRTDS